MAGVDWRSNTPDEWIETVEAWPWEEWTEHDVQLGWLKAGDCQRCGHTIAVYQEFGVLGLTDGVPAFCNCGETHPGRPADDPLEGCGPQAEIEKHP